MCLMWVRGCEGRDRLTDGKEGKAQGPVPGQHWVRADGAFLWDLVSASTCPSLWGPPPLFTSTPILADSLGWALGCGNTGAA